jgi:flagellar biosynthetic protein FliR
MVAGFPLSLIFGFLLVLSRTAGLVAFLPLPGIRAAPMTIRAVLAFAMTLALFPAWPALSGDIPTISKLAAWAITELGFGLTVGLAVAFLNEAFQVGTQMIGMQAGYGYASTIDPNSQADSSVMQVLTMLTTALLFFSMGVDREVIRILAASFEKYPAGSWTPAAGSIEGVLHLGAGMFGTGVRLAMPVITLLLLIDVALALLGRMQQQLQLLSLAFPAKMLAALGIMVALVPIIPKLYTGASGRMLSALADTISH